MASSYCSLTTVSGASSCAEHHAQKHTCMYYAISASPPANTRAPDLPNSLPRNMNPPPPHARANALKTLPSVLVRSPTHIASGGLTHLTHGNHFGPSMSAATATPPLTVCLSLRGTRSALWPPGRHREMSCLNRPLTSDRPSMSHHHRETK